MAKTTKPSPHKGMEERGGYFDRQPGTNGRNSAKNDQGKWGSEPLEVSSPWMLAGKKITWRT